MKPVLGENIKEFLYNLRVGKTFAAMPQNLKVWEERPDHFGYLHTDNNLHMIKCIRSKVKRQMTNWIKTFEI